MFGILNKRERNLKKTVDNSIKKSICFRCGTKVDLSPTKRTLEFIIVGDRLRVAPICKECQNKITINW